MGDSGESIWPTKSSPLRYKFNSVWLEHSQEKVVIERETYSLLDWCGDVGGLFDGLLLLFRQLIGPLAEFTMKTTLLVEIFQTVSSKDIKVRGCLACCKNCRKKRLIESAYREVERQLDLTRFIQK